MNGWMKRRKELDENNERNSFLPPFKLKEVVDASMSHFSRFSSPTLHQPHFCVRFTDCGSEEKERGWHYSIFEQQQTNWPESQFSTMNTSVGKK